MSCLFCKMANNEIGAEVIYQDKAATAVLDIHPRAPGHAMVLPRTHAANVLDLEDRNVEGVFTAVKRVTALLEKALAPDGFTIGINHGAVSGQTVEHLHIHVIPRFHDDGGGSLHSVVNNPPKEDVAVIANKIRGVK